MPELDDWGGEPDHAGRFVLAVIVAGAVLVLLLVGSAWAAQAAAHWLA